MREVSESVSPIISSSTYKGVASIVQRGVESSATAELYALIGPQSSTKSGKEWGDRDQDRQRLGANEKERKG